MHTNCKIFNIVGKSSLFYFAVICIFSTNTSVNCDVAFYTVRGERGRRKEQMVRPKEQAWSSGKLMTLMLPLYKVRLDRHEKVFHSSDDYFNLLKRDLL